MTTFSCDGFRSVKAESIGGAAAIFARRQARRDYGESGYCRTLRLDHWNQDRSVEAYEAFIGRDLYGLTRSSCDRGTTTGHNVFLTVYREE
jgi:hypothetical protein